MNLLGFVGALPHDHSFEDYLDFARTIQPGDAQTIAQRHGELPHALWGMSVASEDGVAVVLRGRPLFKSASTGWNAAAPPAVAVLHAYRHHGDACLQEIGGGFALAIVDTTRRRALLAVDPMGIERLTYAAVGQQLLFGTSAEAVVRFPGQQARVNAGSVLDYLMLHMVPAPETVFEGVRKLRPGGCVVFEQGKTTESRYWKSSFAEQSGADFDGLKDELNVRLRKAVRDCEPGPSTGAFLSGGLDSTTVAGVLSEVGPAPSRTFTIGFGYPEYDEFSYSRAANLRFGCQGHEYVITADDISAGFPLIAKAFDEPFGNSSALPVFFCAKFAKQHGVDHLLAGDGGDELFAGNSRYVEQRVFERYQQVPSWFRKGLLEPTLQFWPAALDFWLTRKAKGYVEKASIPLPARLENWNLLHRIGTSQLLHPDFLACVDDKRTFKNMQILWDSAPANSSLNHMLYYDWQYTLSDNDLRKVGTMTELAGVRVSYPLLHPDVVDLSMRVPPEMKMAGVKLRDFYKRAMTGFLPDEIIHKKKHGFSLPFGLLLQVSPGLREQIYGSLSALRSRNIIRTDFIDRLLQLHGQDDAKYYGVFIWVLAMLEQWMQEHRVAL